MVNSIVTGGVQRTLLELSSLTRSLTRVEQQVSTGKKVATAADDSSTYALAAQIGQAQTAIEPLKTSISLGSETVNTALAGADSLVSLLQDMKTVIIDANATGADFTTLDAELSSLKDQYASIVDATSFNGVNLLAGGADFEVLANIYTDGGGTVQTSNITVARQDFSAISIFGNAGGYANLSVADGTAAAQALTDIDTLIDAAVDANARLGVAQSRFGAQTTFLDSLDASYSSGISALTDVDVAQATLDLEQLRVRYELAIEALRSANNTQQSVISLFR